MENFGNIIGNIVGTLPKKQIYGHKKPRLTGGGNLVKVEPHTVAQSRLEIWRMVASVVGFIQESRSE